MKKLFGIRMNILFLLWLSVFSGIGWAADLCTSSATHAFTSVPGNSYSDNSISLANNTEKNYYFTVPGPGTISVTVSGDVSSYSYYYGLATCTTASMTPTGNGLTFHIPAGDSDVNFKIRANAANKTVSITWGYIPDVVSSPPIMGNVPNQLITVGTPFSLDISAFVTRTDGDSITSYALTGTLPAGLSFDTTTGMLSGTPTAGGTFALSVTASDKDGASNSDSFILSTAAIAGAPVMGDIPNQDIINGVPYTLNIANYAAATDTPIVSYTLTGTLPTGLSFDTATGILSGTPTVNGTYPLSAYATDGDGDPSNSDDFNITVSTVASPSDLLIVKTPLVRYADVNQTVIYYITIANETSTRFDNVSITDILRAYNYNLTTGAVGSEVTGLDFNLTIIDTGAFDCGTVPTTATSFTCTGSVPKRTGNSGVPGLVRIIYSITTPASPVPALLSNTVTIDGTSTHADSSVIVSTGGGGGTVATPPPMHADVIDSDEWVDAATYNANLHRIIKTKIAADTKQLSAIHLDGSATATPYVTGDPDLSFLVIPYLSNGMCLSQEILYDADTGQPAVFNITGGNTIDTKNILIPAHATRDARISVSFLDLNQLYIDSGEKCVYQSSTTGNLEGLGQCVNSANKYYDAFGLSAYERCQVLNGQPCASVNHGRSDPNDNTYNPLYDNDLGCLMCTLNAFPDCSSDNFAIRPNDFNSTITSGQQFTAGTATTITFRADQFGGVGTTDYDESETQATPSFVVDANISDSTKSCQEPSMHFTPRVAFTNGTVTDTYTLPNVGDLNVTMHEIPGSEYALVDADDTPDNVRYITPHQVQIKVIPEHFNIDGNITNGSNNFTYLSNFEVYNNDKNASRKISASLDINVTAKALDNSTTTNYTVNCYAKDGNVTMNLANPLTITPANNLTKMIWYDLNHDLNGTYSPLSGTSYKVGMDHTQFNDNQDTNGTARIDYKINFDRNETKVVNPFTMQVDTMDADDADAVHGDKTLNSAINYEYGRLIPRDVRTFGANVNVVATAWYEVYNDPDINGALPQSRIDRPWYINTSHVHADGDANVTQLQIGSAVSAPVTTTDTISGGAETFNFGNLAIGGYKAHIDIGPWLWYGINALGYVDPATGNTANDCLHHPCFNINVVPAVGATGSSQQGATEEKVNKRSNTSGGWKSTSDYAPAVR